MALLNDTLSSLNAIANTLNTTTNPSDDIYIPEEYPPIILIAAGLMYGSLMASIIAAIVAVMLKRSLNRYLEHIDGSMISRCGDRQRRYNVLEKWTSRLSNSLLQNLHWLSPYCLACGFFSRMAITSFPILITIGVLMVFGGLVYGTLMHFLRSVRSRSQKPVSMTLPNPWKESQTLPASARQGILHNPTDPSPWLTSTALTMLQEASANDTQCILWIIKNITNPVALDMAIQLAGIVQWFEGGFNVGHTYNLIVFTLEGCFDLNGKVYPGLRDRAYYCARAILWIHICAMHIYEEFALAFPLPIAHYDTTSLNCDLKHLLGIFSGQSTHGVLVQMYHIDPGFSPMHLQWTSNALLHLSWVNRRTPGVFDSIVEGHAGENWSTISLNVALNHLLTWCIFLDWPVDRETLWVQEKW